MTLASDIIFQGYRENNLVSINGALTANQTAEGLRLLNSIVGTTFKNEVGENLQDWPVGNVGVNWPSGWNAVFWQYPRINSRIIYNADSPQTIYLPPMPCDGSFIAVVPTNGNVVLNPLTLDGNGRHIEGAATLVIDTDAETGSWFYRADLGEWIKLRTLVAADEMPFPVEFDDYFSIMLAVRLAPRNSNTVESASIEALTRWRRQIAARYSQTVVTPADPAVLRLSEYDATSFNGNGPYGAFGPNGWML